MKTWLIALSIALGATLSAAPFDSDARRLGGGRAAGMQRQTPPPQPAQPATPAQTPGATPAAANAAPAGAAAGAAANAGRRSWMGPIAGLAAGLGIAALLSHLGLGAGFANFLTMLLLAGAAFFVIRWLLRRFAPGGAGSRATQGGLQFAGAGGGARAHGDGLQPTPARSAPAATGALPAAAASGTQTAQSTDEVATSSELPDGFDAAAFERIAKTIFIRLQAANDDAHVEDLRKFTTPELFASLRLDLQERGAAAQRTDVVQLAAQVLDTAREDGQWVVSVRFHGLVREQEGAAADIAAEPFDEVWHLVKPLDGSREWAIAGITPST